MPSIQGQAVAADGTVLLTRHWPADEVEAGGAWAGSPWAVVLLVHGIGEHSGRYEHVGDQMAAAGLDVYAYDHRGNGGSDGRPGHVDDWSEYHDDLAERLADARQAAAGRPLALYGHSLGALIVAGYLTTPRPAPDLAVLSAPALDSTLSAWKQAVAPILGRIAPTFALTTGVDGRTLSRDPSVGERTRTDPLCVKVSTTGFAAAALREQARVRAAAPSGFAVPTLVLHGLDDGLVPPDATAVYEGTQNVERRTYPGLRHELHNEPEGPQVVDEIIGWLRERVIERGTLPA
jgi:alpha-beta hydrolase superfamily lysophospholipase